MPDPEDSSHSELASLKGAKKIKVGNYDVLLEEEKTGKLKLLSCPHVGNNRLEVLLLMNRNEFEESMVAGVDTNPILDRIVDIVTNHCIPPGKFLVSVGDYNPDVPDDDNVWEEIEVGRARQFLNLALLDGGKAGLAGFPEKVNETIPPPPVGKANDAAKKRLRRSSLLRRSVSESFVRNVTSAERASETKEGKKKTVNRRHSSFWSIRKQKALAKVTETEELDVLFNYEQTALLPGHVGNNRLRVLLDIHKEKYEKSDESEQTGSLQEWVRTVTQFWGGRFLRQEEEESNTFEMLDPDQAELALHSVISELTQSAEDPVFALSSQAKTPPSGVDKVPPASLNVQDMRSAAVQSLQKRKKRQGLASRLRNLAASTLTRSSSLTPTPENKPTPSNGTRPQPGVSRASSVPAFGRGGGQASGAFSVPTSPTPPDHQPPRQRRSSANSFSLPRFMTGRASLRRSQNLAADGVGRDLRTSLEADDRELGPEAFGEYPKSTPF